MGSGQRGLQVQIHLQLVMLVLEFLQLLLGAMHLQVEVGFKLPATFGIGFDFGGGLTHRRDDSFLIDLPVHGNVEARMTQLLQPGFELVGVVLPHLDADVDLMLPVEFGAQLLRVIHQFRVFFVPLGLVQCGFGGDRLAGCEVAQLLQLVEGVVELLAEVLVDAHGLELLERGGKRVDLGLLLVEQAGQFAGGLALLVHRAARIVLHRVEAFDAGSRVFEHFGQRLLAGRELRQLLELPAVQLLGLLLKVENLVQAGEQPVILTVEVIEPRLAHELGVRILGDGVGRLLPLLGVGVDKTLLCRYLVVEISGEELVLRLLVLRYLLAYRLQVGLQALELFAQLGDATVLVPVRSVDVPGLAQLLHLLDGPVKGLTDIGLTAGQLLLTFAPVLDGLRVHVVGGVLVLDEHGLPTGCGRGLLVVAGTSRTHTGKTVLKTVGHGFLRLLDERLRLAGGPLDLVGKPVNLLIERRIVQVEPAGDRLLLPLLPLCLHGLVNGTQAGRVAIDLHHVGEGLAVKVAHLLLGACDTLRVHINGDLRVTRMQFRVENLPEIIGVRANIDADRASGIQGHEKTSGRINENPSWNARGFQLETVAAEHGTQHACDLGERLARRGERLRRHRIGLVHHSGRVDGTWLNLLVAHHPGEHHPENVKRVRHVKHEHLRLPVSDIGKPWRLLGIGRRQRMMLHHVRAVQASVNTFQPVQQGAQPYGFVHLHTGREIQIVEALEIRADRYSAFVKRVLEPLDFPSANA